MTTTLRDNYVADCLENLAPKSRASVEYCKGLVSGLLSGLLSCGLNHSRAYQVIADRLPIDYRPDGIPKRYSETIRRREVTVNPKLELYVIPLAPGGYSCLGFDVLIRRSNAVAEWLRENGRTARNVSPDLRGTLEAYAIFRETMRQGEQLSRETGKRCVAELVPQLIGLEGKRVEVIDDYGATRRFWVGKSTGWLPAHLELARRDSTGGGAVTGAPFRSVRILRHSGGRQL
jgi:hypothetical protein